MAISITATSHSTRKKGENARSCFFSGKSGRRAEPKGWKDMEEWGRDVQACPAAIRRGGEV